MKRYYRKTKPDRLNPILGASLIALGLGALRLIHHSHPAGSFRDQVVCITGGGRGLGLAIAREMAKEGARLALCARRPEELEQAAIELRNAGAEVYTFVCDVRDREQVKDAIAAIKTQLGAIDVLINNAGVMLVGPLDATALEDYQEAMDTHYWGALHMMQVVLPDMRARKQGQIANIASIGAKVATPHLVAYCASKAALMALSNGFRTEYAHEGIQFTTVCPGLMATGGQVNSLYRGDQPQEHRWFTELDNAPGVAATAEQAAREIIRGIKRGDAEIYVTNQAKVMARLAGLFPNWSIRITTAFNRLLPAHVGGITRRLAGYQIPFEPTPLMVAADKTAEHNNEYAAVPQTAHR